MFSLTSFFRGQSAVLSYQRRPSSSRKWEENVRIPTNLFACFTQFVPNDRFQCLCCVLPVIWCAFVAHLHAGLANLPYFLGKMAVFDNMELLQLDDASFAWSFVLVMKAFVFSFKGTGCNCRGFLVQWQSRTYMDDFTNNMYKVLQLKHRFYQQYV